MTKKGDSIEDVLKYVIFRIRHLKLEREKVPYYVKQDKIQKALEKLSSKISELEKTKQILNGNIKDSVKHEWQKWQHLKKLKAEINKEKEIKNNH